MAKNIVLQDLGVCFILNFAPHYRTEIYLLLEKELNPHFYFGNETLAKGIKKMDYSNFEHPPKELKFTKLVKSFNYLSGSVSLVFKKKYEQFILTGEPFCLSSWLVMIFARILGKRSFVWTHGWYGDEKGIKKFIKKMYFKLPGGLFLYGNYAKKLMINEGFAASKLHTVYNSLYYTKQLDLRKNLQVSNVNKAFFKNEHPIAIFTGRITKQKKINLLMDALSYSIDNNLLVFNLLIIGDGPELSYLKNYAISKGLEDYCYFMGACYEEIKLADYFFNADVCVSPGEIGLTGIHSLSYGTPIITHDNFPTQMPEFEAIIPGENGAFFKENNVKSLAKTIHKWLVKNKSKSNGIIENCFGIIDSKYNPYYQVKIISDVLRGKNK